MAKLLYKRMVEMDMGMNAVLDCIQVDDDYLRKLRSDSVRSVKATNGLLTFEQKVKGQVDSAEGDNPHVHMMAWSVKPGQAYLSKDGIKKTKSVLTNDIFKQEMLHTYAQKSASRDELVRQARETMKTLAGEMRQSIGDHPEVEALMMTLATQLKTVVGKKNTVIFPRG